MARVEPLAFCSSFRSPSTQYRPVRGSTAMLSMGKPFNRVEWGVSTIQNQSVETCGPAASFRCRSSSTTHSPLMNRALSLPPYWCASC